MRSKLDWPTLTSPLTKVYFVDLLKLHLTYILNKHLIENIYSFFLVIDKVMTTTESYHFAHQPPIDYLFPFTPDLLNPISDNGQANTKSKSQKAESHKDRKVKQSKKPNNNASSNNSPFLFQHIAIIIAINFLLRSYFC